MTIAYRSGNGAVSSTTAMSVTKPAGSVAGDKLVYIIALLASAADTYGTLTWPSGFTQEGAITSQAGDFAKLLVATKLAGASEPATYDATWSLSYYMQGIVLAFSGGNVPIVSAIASAIDTGNDTSIVAPTVTPLHRPSMLLSIYQHGHTNAASGLFGARCTPPGGQTKRIEVDGDGAGGYMNLCTATEALSSLSATGTRTATMDYGAKRSLGISLVLRDDSASYAMMKGM